MSGYEPHSQEYWDKKIRNHDRVTWLITVSPVLLVLGVIATIFVFGK
jgi:uncharacterized membrane protein YjdF